MAGSGCLRRAGWHSMARARYCSPRARACYRSHSLRGGPRERPPRRKGSPPPTHPLRVPPPLSVPQLRKSPLHPPPAARGQAPPLGARRRPTAPPDRAGPPTRSRPAPPRLPRAALRLRGTAPSHSKRRTQAGYHGSCGADKTVLMWNVRGDCEVRRSPAHFSSPVPIRETLLFFAPTLAPDRETRRVRRTT